MNSSIFGNTKYQELNMSFTFDEQHQDKLIANALVDQNSYQLELLSNPDLDFQDFKSALLAKQFKIVSMSPETLKIKILFASFEFKNVQKMTLNTLKETISELNSKLTEQCQKIKTLENSIKELRNGFDLMTTKMADLNCVNDENKQELAKLNEKNQQQNMLINELKTQVVEHKKMTQIIQKQLSSEKKRIETQEQAARAQKIKGEDHEKRIVELECEIKRVKGKMNENEQTNLKALEQFSKKVEAEQQKIEIIFNNKNYKFFSGRKGKSIVIDDYNSKATNPINQPDGEQLALVEGYVNKRGSSIRFKIQTIGNFVAVGMVLRNVVAANSYELKNWKEIGHGCFLIFNSGRSYSHSNKEYNFVESDFNYRAGDVIRVETDENELVFVNETSQKEHKTKVSLSEKERKQICFSVLLCGKGDSVLIQ